MDAASVIQRIHQEKWNSFDVQGWSGFVIKEKVKLLKSELKHWKDEVFGCLDKKIEDKKSEIEELDLVDDVFGLDLAKTEKRASLLGELTQDISRRDAQLFQKSRAKWVQKGDLNSRFYHNWIKSNQKRSEINRIWVGNVWVTRLMR